MPIDDARKPGPATPRDHLEDLLDEAEQESFPASDPPAVTPRREPVRPTPEQPAQDSEHKRG